MTLALTRTPQTEALGRCTPPPLLTLAVALCRVRDRLGHLELLDTVLAGLAAKRAELDADQAMANRMPHAAEWRRELAGTRGRITAAELRVRENAAQLITGRQNPHRTRWVTPNTSQEYRTGGQP